MLRALIEKVDGIQEQMGKQSEETLNKNKKKYWKSKPL